MSAEHRRPRRWLDRDSAHGVDDLDRDRLVSECGGSVQFVSRHWRPTVALSVDETAIVGIRVSTSSGSIVDGAAPFTGEAHALSRPSVSAERRVRHRLTFIA